MVLKRYLPVLTLLLLTLFMGSPGWGLTLKIATISPEGSMWMTQMRRGAEQVALETEKRVKFKFYPGGVMGNDNAVLRKIRAGQLQGGALVGGSLSKFFPANQIYAQPMKFSSQEEVDHVREQMDPFIMDGLYQAGFVTFGVTGGGFAYIMSKEPIETPADFKDKKVWIPDNDQTSLDAVRAFNINPIILPLSDVRTGLQSGLIDTVGTSPVGAVVLQWHTQIKYVTNIPLIYLYGIMAVDKKKFMKISEPDREIVSRIMTRAFKEIDARNREDNIKAVEALKKRGIRFITPSGKELEQWRTTASKASEKMKEDGTLPADVVDKMDAILAEFRAKTP
ncbi:TRAP transporter substrate-binding protein DctP [Desulfospira joergensenii]|uniref:TRAP transporter substrate-binding protein n=1 Tax=Desulfospira joergensenii TaxID=53329 RepID=UPI0003B6DE8E|nr:TRAP transporter substrate-binding protein DctP [Desulfospira joergensenii]